mgnify:CR=1 FL=1
MPGKKACEASGITQKALRYYEMKNLISPTILENGYREYSEEDILEIYSDFNIALIGVSSEYIDTIRTRVRILEQKTGIHVSDQYERLQEVIGY